MKSNKRSDGLKNKAKVIKDVLENPIKSQRERARDLGIGKTTVQEHLSDIKATKDDRILGICEKDIQIVKLGQEIIEKRLKDKKETDKMRTFEIAQTIEKSERRYMLFRGEATDKDGGLYSIATILNEIQGLDNQNTNN